MWSWQHIRHHRQHVKKYREIYKNKITSKKPAESLLKEFEVGEHWAFSDTVHTMKICCYLLIVMLFQTHMLLFFLLSRHIAAFFLSLIAVITMNCLFDLANIAVFWFGVWYNELTNISCFYFLFWNFESLWTSKYGFFEWDGSSAFFEGLIVSMGCSVHALL